MAIRTNTDAAYRVNTRMPGATGFPRMCWWVRDNGTGIRAENLDKIFDPFFTTKNAGEGMGLGLAVCKRIVQDFNGEITVRSEVGKFCEFVLTFPAKEWQSEHEPIPLIAPFVS